MKIHTDFSLKNYNTFGINAKAKQFVSVESTEELIEVLEQFPNEPKFILGGGSNMLLTKDIDALVIHIDLKGIKVIDESDDEVWVEGQAGENWHEFVQWNIKHNYGGLENLSLIPGNVGTTPIQNIGAYGVEIKDTMVLCEAIHIPTLEKVIFTNKECGFGYRESVFKNEMKGEFIITSVVYKLTKRMHQLHTSYGAIASELEKNNITKPTIQQISKAVIAIRNSKLPNPKELGNSGSFFKNPIISKTLYETLVAKFPTMPHYNVSETLVKVPAGWLIETTGFKGKRIGDAGVHKDQALVLVNYGTATGIEILELSQLIQKTIFDTFGITIEAEVNVI
jgi:UDP-N-acetylmuramate dehydrogenase